MKKAYICIVACCIVICAWNIMAFAAPAENNHGIVNKDTSALHENNGDKNEKINERGKLDAETLAKKREGWSGIPLPLVNYNSDIGIGFGAMGALMYNGRRSDKYYEYAPYFYMLVLQGFYTTNDMHNHYIMLDMPYFLKTKTRIKMQLKYLKELNATYYGTGRNSSNHLFTRYGIRYNTQSSYYKTFLSAYDPFNGISPLYIKPVNYKYNNYTITAPYYLLNCYYDVFDYVKIYCGVKVKHASVRSWRFRHFNTSDHKNVISAPTLMDIDPALIGKQKNGWINNLSLGIAFDSRDYDPDPRNGVLVSYVFNVVTRYIGSNFDFLRHTFEFKGYYSPVRQLTFAVHLGYTTTSGKIPFHELGWFSFFYGDQPGVGHNTLRGYDLNRFVSDTMTTGSAEVRWEFVEFYLLKQRFALKLIAFCDTGSIFKNEREPFVHWSSYKLGYGGGLALSFNQAAIARVYIGMSREHGIQNPWVSVDFEHAF